MPVVFFFLVVAPAVFFARRWYAEQAPRVLPWFEAWCGGRKAATERGAGVAGAGGTAASSAVEGSPLLPVGGKADAGPPRTQRELFLLDLRDMSVCVVGVMASHLTYGYYQELLMTTNWGADAEGRHGEQFLHASFTTLLNRVASLVLALCFSALARAVGGRPHEAAAAPLWEYSVGALANNVSSVAQYASLHFISFPTLVLSKAAKMPPVMIVNVLVFRRGYRAFEYTGAVLVLMGAFLWLLYDTGSSQRYSDSFRATDTPGGILLVAVYILADAYASTWQGAVFSRGTSIYPMFLWSNAWSVGFLFLSTFATAEYAEAMGFLRRHTDVWPVMVGLSISSSTGNLFLLYTIQRFGPLAFASIATVRQLISSFISIAQFHHVVHLLQIVGLLIVFGALGLITRIKLHERFMDAEATKAQQAAADAKATAEDAQAKAKAAREAAAGGGRLRLPWSKRTLADGDDPDAGLPPDLPSPGHDARRTAMAHAQAQGKAQFRRLSDFGRSVSRTAELPCLSPPQRALLVLLLVVVVAVGKSWLTRSSILSTAVHEAPGQPVATTGVAFSALSCASTVLCCILIFLLEPGALGTPDIAVVPALAVITFFSAVDLGCTNAAIARLSAPLQQVLASLNPIFTIALESMVGCEVKNPLIYCVVATLTLGAALVAYGNIHGPLPDFAETGWGVTLMLIAVFASALKYVLLRRLSVRTRLAIGTVSFVFWVDMVSFLALSIAALLNQEFTAFVKSLLSAASPGGLSLVVFVSASLGGVRFFTEVFALRFVAAIDLSAAKSLANVLFILTSLAFPLSFDDMTQVGIPQTPDTIAAFATGLTLVFLSLLLYWVLQRTLGPNRLVVYRLQGNSCCASVRDALGEHGFNEVSDMARGSGDGEDGPRHAAVAPLDCCGCFGERPGSREADALAPVGDSTTAR